MTALNGPVLIVYQKGVIPHYHTNPAVHYAQRKQIGPLPGPVAPQCAASPCRTRYALHPERTLNKSSHLLSYCVGVLPDQHTQPRGRNDRRRAYARVLAARVLRAILAAPAQPRAPACACVRVRAGIRGACARASIGVPLSQFRSKFGPSTHATYRWHLGNATYRWHSTVGLPDARRSDRNAAQCAR